MEVTIANRRDSSFSVDESKNDKAEFKKNVKFSTSSTKEAITISKAELVRITGRQNSKEKRSEPFKNTIRRCPLKELQEKKYLFLDSDLLGMSDDLLEKEVIQLLDSKRPEEVGRTADPKYFCYHRMVSHPLEKCVMLKEHMMRLIEDGTIILDFNDMVETNHISC